MIKIVLNSSSALVSSSAAFAAVDFDSDGNDELSKQAFLQIQ